MVSNIYYFHPYLGKIPILTNIFQMGWNHQPALFFLWFTVSPFPRWLPRSRVVSLRSLCRYLSSSLPYRLAAHGRRPGLLGCGLPRARRQRGATDGGDPAECSKPNGGPKHSEDVTSGEDVTWTFFSGKGWQMIRKQQKIPWWGFKLVWYISILDPNLDDS